MTSNQVVGDVHHPGKAQLMDDGYVVISGRRTGQVLKLKRTRVWIFREPAGVHSARTWPSKEACLDELFGAGGWS